MDKTNHEMQLQYYQDGGHKGNKDTYYVKTRCRKVTISVFSVLCPKPHKNR